MPPAKPLPEIHDLEAGGVERRDHAALAPYSGIWWNAREGRRVCEIRGGLLTWSERYDTRHGPLSIGPQGELVMELGGKLYSGVLENDSADRLLWNDGDVWLRGAQPFAAEASEMAPSPAAAM